MEQLGWVLAGIVTIVAVSTFSPRVGVASPLILLGIGIAVGLLPFVPVIEVDHEWILAGVLPPLLYSAAINVPTTDFRRDLRTISALSLLLVVVSAVAVGAVMSRLIPGVGLAAGVALGAIIAPTDAVATALVKGAGVSPRIVTVLEGESLLNDASALVLLKSAVAAVSVSVSLWTVAGRFVWAVVGALVIGWVVGELNLLIRSHLADSPASVAVSAVAPFAAYLPAEHVGASGLVAAVAAGIVTGQGSLTRLSAEDRLTERAVWRTLAVVLEGGVFLVMGLQLYGLLRDVHHEHGRVDTACLYALAAGALVIALRLVFVAGFVGYLGLLGRRSPALKERLTDVQIRVEDADWAAQFAGRAAPGRTSNDTIERRRAGLLRRITQKLADLDYFAAERFGWREITVLSWAGMRGAVTLAAAQSLPTSMPERPVLVLVAFLVAAGSLAVQGGTLSPLVRVLGIGGHRDDSEAQRAALAADLSGVIIAALDDGTFRRADGSAYPPELVDRVRRIYAAQTDEEQAERVEQVTTQTRTLRLDLIALRRGRLAELRELGTISSAVLAAELDQLDAEELALTMGARD